VTVEEPRTVVEELQIELVELRTTVEGPRTAFEELQIELVELRTTVDELRTAFEELQMKLVSYVIQIATGFITSRSLGQRAKSMGNGAKSVLAG